MAETQDAVVNEVGPLADRFTAAGFRLFLVGGIVRDLQLDAPLEQLDFDLTTDARPEQIKELVAPLATAVWTQGERFGTIGCRIGGRPVEITTHRAESYGSDSRKPDVVFGDDIAVDLSRRDFTVNAMAIEVPSGALIDPFDGRTALTERVLETPIDPAVSFGDDPLRILRAARFIARYDLVPIEGLSAAAATLIERLAIVSVERIREEYDKLMAAPRPSSGLLFLDSIGAVPHIFASLPPGSLHDLSAVLDRAPVDLIVRRLVTFSFIPEDGREGQLSTLRYSNQERRSLQAILDGLEVLIAEPATTDESIRRLVQRVGYANMPDLFTLGELRQAGGVVAVQSAFDDLAAREDLSDLSPVLTGGRIISELGLEPGPSVGEAVAALGERRLSDGPATEAEELAWLRSRG